MATRESVSFGKMVRTFPGRTALFTVGPVLFGLVQFLNGYLNDGSLLFTAMFLSLMVAFSVLVTRYHMTTFRIRRLTDETDWRTEE